MISEMGRCKFPPGQYHIRNLTASCQLRNKWKREENCMAPEIFGAPLKLWSLALATAMKVEINFT
jgi:hypothetical protein